jgi:hypothetical protein
MSTNVDKTSVYLQASLHNNAEQKYGTKTANRSFENEAKYYIYSGKK